MGFGMRFQDAFSLMTRGKPQNDLNAEIDPKNITRGCFCLDHADRRIPIGKAIVGN